MPTSSTSLPTDTVPSWEQDKMTKITEMCVASLGNPKASLDQTAWIYGRHRGCVPEKGKRLFSKNKGGGLRPLQLGMWRAPHMHARIQKQVPGTEGEGKREVAVVEHLICAGTRGMLLTESHAFPQPPGGQVF